MTIRIQSSWEISEKGNKEIEFASAIKRKKFILKVRNPALLSFIDCLKSGVECPEELSIEAQKRGLDENALQTLIISLKNKGILIEDKKNRVLSAQELPYDRQIQ